jgi:hypothetical protein
MDDALYGQRDKRGNWKPFKRVEYPGVFIWPAQPRGILKWLFSYPSYILPWNLLYAFTAVVVWLYLTPPVETLQTFAPGHAVFRRLPFASLREQSPRQHVQVQRKMA